MSDIPQQISLKDCVKIINTDGQLITKTSMAAIEGMLPLIGFLLRIHRFFFIATGKLTAYHNTRVKIRALELRIGKM